jgi:arylsulfatase A-like enzyme
MKFALGEKFTKQFRSNNMYSGIGFFGFILISLFLLFFQSNGKPNVLSVDSKKPNVVFIVADDLGYGDLSVYSQTKFSTPHIDQLAKEGLLFTQFYAGSTVCAPSRASLLTGQHTGHTQIRGNKPTDNGQMPLQKNTYTLAKLFKENDYTTGAFGKWGLGNSGTSGDPLHHGFDYFYGYHDQMLAHHYYPYYLWNNDKTVKLEKNQGLNKGQYAPDLIHNEALSFIEKHKDEPFFLFYPSIIPHAELFAPEEYMNQFVGKYPESYPFKGLDEGEKYKHGNYGSQEHPRAAFAAMMTLLDDQVGELVQKVKDLGLEDNTIFIFTSDNGPHREGGATPEFFDSNGRYRGLKRSLFEGGIRVPMIVKWPNEIQPHTKTNHISAFWDILPTFAELFQTELSSVSDGISLLPTLTSNPQTQNEHEYLYWEFHEKNAKQALRKGDWKLVITNLETKPKTHLFNLANDPEESQNLAEINPEKTAELKKLMVSARTTSPDFKFNKYDK